VAPLKQALFNRDGILQRDFHGRNAVAPLKPSQTEDGEGAERIFPRQKCRGPIEAAQVERGASNQAKHFHGRNAVAPLKQLRRIRYRYSVPYFHGRNAVAPLKRRQGAAAQDALAEFPRQKCRGPIEAGTSAVSIISQSPISTAEMPWPH